MGYDRITVQISVYISGNYKLILLQQWCNITQPKLTSQRPAPLAQHPWCGGGCQGHVAWTLVRRHPSSAYQFDSANTFTMASNICTQCTFSFSASHQSYLCISISDALSSPRNFTQSMTAQKKSLKHQLFWSSLLAYCPWLANTNPLYCLTLLVVYSCDTFSFNKAFTSSLEIHPVLFLSHVQIIPKY